MTELEAIKARHAVRKYLDKSIDDKIVNELNKEIAIANKEGNLIMQLIINDEEAFKSFIPAFGRFKNVKNYIALVGKKSDKLMENCGYFGEKIALLAQSLGLNSCWVASSYKKSKCKAVVKDDEELICVISIGYGVDNGSSHKSKEMDELCKMCQEEWFINGMKASMLAPTGLNRQNFYFKNDNGKVTATINGDSRYAKIDLGIVKYHFEVGAVKTNFTWK